MAAGRCRHCSRGTAMRSSPPRPPIKGFLKVVPDGFQVGAVRKGTPDYDEYRGPVADIDWNKSWLTICTDLYEGVTSINIEALPHLRRALARVAREIKAGRIDSSKQKAKVPQ